MPLLPEIHTRPECDCCGPNWWQHQDYAALEVDAPPLFSSHTQAREDLEAHFGWVFTDEEMLCLPCVRMMQAEPVLSVAEDVEFARLVADVQLFAE